ncbi:trypsin-like peptidase domain-containing protein [Streptomyces kanasensis]|uniref:trypsin-like peptidase domain-containing protein n=1 Tax=Streptomyces kanasensis TaxID=936756 RepID=UPI0038238899
MDSDRVVRVAHRQGWASGFEISPRLVLTAAHAVHGVGSPLRVASLRSLRSGRWYAARVVWRGEPAAPLSTAGAGDAGGRVDAALVHIESADWDGGAEGPVRWGRVVAERVPVSCRAWGFPRSEHPSGEVEQAFGTISPGSGLVGGTYVIDCNTGRARDADGSPWAGMSGAAVLCDDLLTGVVTADLPGHTPARLRAEPAAVLLRAEGFRETLDAYGARGHHVPEPVEYAAVTDPDGTTAGEAPHSLAELLLPDREIVPFRGRDGELAALRSWSRTPGPGVCVLHAPGGRGKSRLALEFGRTLPPRWAVLRLGQGRADAVRELPPPAVPLLVVVDGADTRVTDTAAVLELMTRHRRAPIKALLLARSDTWWTDQVCRPSVTASTLMARALNLPLPEQETGPIALATAYEDAAGGFASALPRLPGWRHHPWRTLAERLAPPTAHDGLGSPLTLHMTALVDLLDAATNRAASGGGAMARHAGDTASVEEQLLTHERGHWLNVADGHAPLTGLSEEALLNAMTAAVALGARDRRHMADLLTRVELLRDQSDDRRRAVSQWIQAALPATGGRIVGDLRPDRLAEHFVGSSLRGESTLADGFLPGADPAQAARFLTLLTRACARGVLDEEKLIGWCVRHRDVLARPAIDVATQVEVPDPLVRALTAISDAPDVTLPELEGLADHLPASTYNLAPWALHLARRIVEAHRAQAGDDPERLARLAVALRELSKHLEHMDCHEEARHAAEEAIAVWRNLPAPHPRRLSEWGSCHSNRALSLVRLGRRDDALRSARTAVHALALVEPAEAAETLDRRAKALTTLAEAERSLGDHQAAVHAITGAVALSRRLAARDPDRYTPLLADALQNQAVYQLDAGHPAEALEAVRAAVELHETLAEARPDAFRPALALALATLSSASQLMGLRGEALAASRRSVAMRRVLAEARPDVYLADLATTLNHLSIDLDNLGLADESLEAIEESVRLFRGLAHDHPDRHRPRLALTLNSLANRLSSAERHTRAVATAQEAVEGYRRLAVDQPAAFRSELAMALVTLAHTLTVADRPTEARPFLEEAAAHYRSLAAADPGAHAHDLATCLNNLAVLLHRLDDPATALALVDEAVDLGTALEANGSGAYADGLARNRLVQYLCLVDLGRYDDAATAAIEAVDRLRALAREAPQRYEETLVSALSATNALLHGTGHGERASEQLDDAVVIGRRLARDDPERHQEALAANLEAQGDHLWLLGRERAALRAAAEAARHRRAAHRRRGTHTTALAAVRAATVLGARLTGCGHRAHALRVTRQAVNALRPLHAAAPDAHAAVLAQLLAQAQLLLFHAGAADAAMDTGAEAVRIGREAAGARSDDRTADQVAGRRAAAEALLTHGFVGGELHRHGSVDVLGEAVVHCRELAARATPEDELLLARALGCHGRLLAADQRRHAEALRCTAEAVDLCRTYAGHVPILRSPLASLLTTHGLRLAEAGHAREAAAHTDDALESARTLAAGDRRAHRDLLAHALEAVARARLLAGDRSAYARDAAREACDLFEEIARDEPAATLPYLRQARETRERLGA